MSYFKKTLLVCWFGVFTTSMGLSQIAPILPLFIKQLGHSDPKDIAFYSGLAFGITPLFMAIFSPVWAFVGARYGYKRMLVRASLGMAILSVWLCFVGSAQEVVIVRAMTGVVSGFTSAAVVFIASLVPKRHVAYALGTLSTASISGSLIGPLFGGVVAEFLGIQAVFAVIALLLFCSFLTISLFVREDKIAHKETQNSKRSQENYSLIALLFATTFVIQVGTFGSMPILSVFVEQIHTGSHIAFWTGIVVAASGISDIVCSPQLGKIADRIGAEKIILLSLVFCGTCFYLQSLCSNVYWLTFVRLLIGVGLGGLLPCVNALIKKSVSANRLNVIFGFNQTCQFLGNFTGAVGGGIVASKWSASLVFASICTMFLCTALVFFVMQRRAVLSR